MLSFLNFKHNFRLTRSGRNSTEEIRWTCHHASPNGDFLPSYSALSKSGNQHWHNTINMPDSSYSDLSIVSCTHFLIVWHIILRHFITCIDLNSHHHNQDGMKRFHYHKKFSICYTFILTPSFSFPNPCQPLRSSPFVWFYILRMWRFDIGFFFSQYKCSCNILNCCIYQ